MKHSSTVTALVLTLALAACQPAQHAKMSRDPRDARDPLLAAVYYRDAAAVSQLLAKGHPPDQSEGEQPLTVTTASDQFVIAEQLLLAGADPYHVDRFGVGPLEFIVSSRESPASADGQALLRISQLLADRDIRLPPPTRTEILERKRRGLWPPPPK